MLKIVIRKTQLKELKKDADKKGNLTNNNYRL